MQIFIFVLITVNVLPVTPEIGDIIETAKDEIKKWRDQAKEMYQNKRSSYFFREPDKIKVIQNYVKVYSKFGKIEKREERIKLGRIAFYLRLAKDYLVDPRKRTSGNTYSSFPVPFLKNFDPVLEEACSTDFRNCTDSAIKIIDNTYWFSTAFFGIKETKLEPATNDSDKVKRLLWKNISEKEFRGYRTPFKDLEHQFIFTSTLSYYFCWFTMLRLSIISFLPYCDYTTEWFSGFADKNIMLESWNFVDVMDDVPFRCAQFSFCPDPCCVRTAMIQPDCDEDQLNPCKNLLHKKCLMKPEENDNFVQMVQNSFNKSCKCNTPGFRYESAINECFDNDECETGEAECLEAATICVNTVGSFSCICKLGYSTRNLSGPCQPSHIVNELKREWSSGCNILISNFVLFVTLCMWVLCNYF